MKQIEEIYARQFYQELKEEFWGNQNPISKFFGLTPNKLKSDIGISLKEAGTQSECTITKQSRQCSIHCFDIDRMDLKYRGLEFCTTFIADGKPITHGRTLDKLKTMQAIRNWIQNKTVEELYSNFDFIDQNKRQLEKLRAYINTSNTQLLTISQNEVAEEFFSSYSLWFKHENRSCRIYYDGYKPSPRYIFNWDDCLIFETSSYEIHKVGCLINKWVLDQEMPTTLRMEFPEVEFGKLAEYYEMGNGIEGEFILSWDSIEDFYRELNLDISSEILQLIRQMRDKGFEKTLRAGQSLYTLVLSRSRRHGLRPNQDSVSFSFHYIESAMEVWTRKGQKITFDKIEYNDTIENLLKTIELESID